MKQVIVLRKDLNMRKGKMIAQGAHASMKFLTTRLKVEGNYAAGSFTDKELEWIKGNFKKIVVSVNSEEELLMIHNIASMAGITSALIEDQGLTEFGGKPTLTAIAIGPDTDEILDPLTGHLKLL